MDTIYSNKKYLQSLTAGSDYYRSSPIRNVSNDYTSYQNTMGRRSSIGPAYTHMNKYSYPTDVSISSHYAYNNSWGLWRDTRNLSPSAFSTNKKQKNIKSFSIILMTAAFIVVLAVISVAGLAFYFSTFKADVDESVLAFDGNFRVSKGDVYTTGLRFNQTSAFRQKTQFYEKLIKSALENHKLIVSKCEIHGFGDGPLVHVHFRVFLDMRQIPMTINNVEEHIARSLLDEVLSPKSNFKQIKVDPDTIEIKRLLDQEILKSALFIHDVPSEEHSNFVTTQTTNSTVISFNEKDKISKKSGVVEKTQSRAQSNNKVKSSSKVPITETEIDVENLPVIQGSFEVTKTDADITKRKSNTSTHVTVSVSTLKPFIVSPAVIKIKENVVGLKSVIGNVDKTTTRLPVTTITYVKQTTTMPTTTKTTNAPITTTEPIQSSTNAPPTTTAIPVEDFIKSTPQSVTELADSVNIQTNVKNLPKLDVSLFTSPPVLDNEPWRPITPTIAQINKYKQATPKDKTIPEVTNMDIIQNPFIEKETGLKNKIFNKFSEQITDSPNRGSIYYQSFTNPGFSISTKGIERLGMVDVKPYPIPVNKIALDEIPDFKYVKESMKETVVDSDKTKFQYLGGGVLVRKNGNQNNNETETAENLISETKTEELQETSTQFSANLGDLLLDLLAIHEDKSRTPEKPFNESIFSSLTDTEDNILTTTTEDVPTTIFSTVTSVRLVEPEFKNKETNIEALLEEADNSTTIIHTTSTEKPTSTFIEIKTVQNNSTSLLTTTSTDKPHTTTKRSTTTPGLWHEEPLFPLHSKWEFINGTLITPRDSMKKIFNETLQALVVENEQMKTADTKPNSNNTIKDIHRKNSDNLQNISSMFDTLASKLGITEIPSKAPPYAMLAQNKFKTSNIPKTTPKIVIETSTMIEENEEAVPVLLDSSSIIGQAEVEVIDPNKFEEILKLQTSSTTPSLVTLLPVKSNSGIRTFKRPIKANEKRGFETQFREAIVRTSVNVQQ